MAEADDPVGLGDVDPGAFIDEPLPPAGAGLPVEPGQEGLGEDALVRLLPRADMDVGQGRGVIDCRPPNQFTPPRRSDLRPGSPRGPRMR